jgi:hypothetical protein
MSRDTTNGADVILVEDVTPETRLRIHDASRDGELKPRRIMKLTFGGRGELLGELGVPCGF